MKKLSLFLIASAPISILLFAVLFLNLRHSSVYYPNGTINPHQLTGEFNPSEKYAFFDQQAFATPRPLAQRLRPLPSQVLGQTSASKRIEVDLTHQRLYAYEGRRQVYNFLISSGKWGRTPTGNFNIWIKLRYAKMEGGSKAKKTYYYLPNVPYVMYFSNNQIPKWRGFGLHGTYWHNNFGHPMSHGCINMKTEEIAQLYYWAQPDLKGKQSIWATIDNPGTPVIIYGQAPRE